jgi:hypothetical protein
MYANDLRRHYSLVAYNRNKTAFGNVRFSDIGLKIQSPFPFDEQVGETYPGSCIDVILRRCEARHKTPFTQ